MIMPAGVMLATATLELVHATALLNATPDESNVTTLVRVWWGTARVVESMATCTRAAVGFNTKTGMLPVTPSTEPAMNAEPGATATTTPLDETVATAVLEEDHETAMPMSTLPEASRTTADACAVLVGVSDVGPTVTATCAALLCPLLDASAAGAVLDESEQLCVVSTTRSCAAIGTTRQRRRFHIGNLCI